MTRLRWDSLLAAIAAGLAVAGCDPKSADGDGSGNPDPDNPIRKLLALQQSWADSYCNTCVDDESYFSSVEQCMTELSQLFPDADGECAATWLDETPSSRPYFECMYGAHKDLYQCQGEPICASSTFACESGAEIPAEYFCDGWEDCDDASDEPDGCYYDCSQKFVDAMQACPYVSLADAEALYAECNWPIYEYIDEYVYDAGGSAGSTGHLAEEVGTLLRGHEIPGAPNLSSHRSFRGAVPFANSP